MAKVTSLNADVCSWALDNGFSNPVLQKAEVLEAYNAAHSKRPTGRKNSKRHVKPVIVFKDGSHDNIVLDEIPFSQNDVYMAVYSFIMANTESLGMTFDREDLKNITVALEESRYEELGTLTEKIPE